MAGSGAWGIPDLLLQADVGFVLDATLTACDYQKLILRERERFRRQGLQLFSEEELPYCLRKETTGHQAQRWLAIPECLADLLCESAQLLAQTGTCRAGMKLGNSAAVTPNTMTPAACP